MAEAVVTVAAEALEDFVERLFVAAGMETDDGRHCANCIVQADLWGVESHGVLRVPIYVERLRNGAVNPRPRPRLVRGAGALEVLDGDAGPGFIAGRDAMRRAIELAGAHNVGVVGVTNSNHFGAAGLYARLAVEQGMIGVAMSNVVAKLVAPGGVRPITGNNPLAVAVPTYGEFPFVLDMSLSAAAGGKLLLAAQRGEKIPLDWATDAQGRPTDDPTEAFAGFYLPIGGMKGLGLSFVVDILSGLITGGDFGSAVKSMYDQPTEPTNTGHLMLALRVEAIIAEDEMRGRMARFVDTVHGSSTDGGDGHLLIPGERAHRTAQQRRRDGVPLTQVLYAQLLALGRGLDLADSLRARPAD